MIMQWTGFIRLMTTVKYYKIYIVFGHTFELLA